MGGVSFITNNSKIAALTIRRLRNQRKEIMSTPPKRTGAPKTPQHVLDNFVKHLNMNDNSEPADSGTAPVTVSKGIKSPERHLTKPVNAILNDYKAFNKH